MRSQQGGVRLLGFSDGDIRDLFSIARQVRENAGDREGAKRMASSRKMLPTARNRDKHQWFQRKWRQ